MTTLHYVKKARKNIYQNGKQIKRKNKKGVMVTAYDTSMPENKKDELIVKKGESYYWWQFAFGSKNISTTHPRRSQYLTRSEHLGGIYDLEDQLAKMTIDEIDDSCLDDVIQEIENIRDTCQERLDNMPEQLQEAPSGQTLQEYIDNLEQWQSDLEGINLTVDIDEDDEESEENSRQEVLDEIQNCSYPG